MSEEQKKKLLEQLDALKIFPKNKIVRELEKQIRSKLEKLEKKEKQIISKSEPKEDANKTRSSKLKKYHRYMRLIRDNYPDLSYSEIRKQFAKRRDGFDSDVPDVVWQNPSP